MASTTINTRIVLKNDTAANWAASSLVLLKGEIGIESDTGKIKIGNGTDVYADLPYVNMTPTEIQDLISSGAVQSVSLATGTNNGTLKLTVDGTTTDNIAVKGLGTAAYTASSAYATAAQGTLATNAVRSVVTGSANGTISVTTGTGSATDVAVKGLASAAYKTAGSASGNVPVNGAALGTTANVPVVTNASGQLIPHASGALGSAAFTASSAYATAAQGAKADSAVQTVALASGTNNGTLKITVNGTATDNVAVKGLGSAAYTASSAYATAAQGTKADNAMPKAGGTFTGAVTLAADPTSALHPATKQYVDSQISSSIAASDAMVFKGTIGTGGTVTALPTSAVVGDTYKAIASISVPADNSYTGSAVTAKTGDLIVAMSTTPTWIVVPSGDEAVTSIRYATSGVSLSTSYQTGSITLGAASIKQVDTSISAGSTSANLPTAAAVATFVEGKGYYSAANPQPSVAKLTTARTIALSGAATGTATSFDGSANITIPVTSLDATKLTGTASISTTGNAKTATTLATARTIGISGGAVGTATSFNGSADITIPVTSVNTDFFVNGSNTLIFDCGSAA